MEKLISRGLPSSRHPSWSILLKPTEPVNLFHSTTGAFDLTTADVASSIRRQTLTTLEVMESPLSIHSMKMPPQHEIDLRYTDALTMADNVMTFRLIVRKIALEHGVHATFMPKLLTGVFRNVYTPFAV